MKQYHKINTIFKRDMANKGKIIVGNYAEPEFGYLWNNLWVWTEKVDGTNIRVMWQSTGLDEKNVDLVFGGKTDNAQLYAPLVKKLQEVFAWKKMFKVFGGNTAEDSAKVCLYGEGYGAKIQKGGGNYISDSVDFVLFDVKIGELWLRRKDVEDIANKFSIKVVPIVGEGTLGEAVEKVREGFNSNWGEFMAEGLVLRPKIELKNRRGFRIITKIKHRDFKTN